MATFSGLGISSEHHEVPFLIFLYIKEAAGKAPHINFPFLRKNSYYLRGSKKRVHPLFLLIKMYSTCQFNFNSFARGKKRQFWKWGSVLLLVCLSVGHWRRKDNRRPQNCAESFILWSSMTEGSYLFLSMRLTLFSMSNGMLVFQFIVQYPVDRGYCSKRVFSILFSSLIFSQGTLLFHSDRTFGLILSLQTFSFQTLLFHNSSETRSSMLSIDFCRYFTYVYYRISINAFSTRAALPSWNWDSIESSFQTPKFTWRKNHKLKRETFNVYAGKKKVFVFNSIWNSLLNYLRHHWTLTCFLQILQGNIMLCA